MPPCTCTPIDATSQPMSVENALATGVSSATRFTAAARCAGSLARRAMSVSLAVTRQMARAAWVSAFMVSRLRRMSGCSTMGAMSVRPGGDAAALLALPCIGESALGGALGQGHALHAHRQAGRVHHDEHDVEATVLLAHQVADGAVLLAVLHHAGGACMDAELVLDAGADDVVARAQRAIGVHQILRHEEQRDAARAGRRVGQAGEDELDDVVGHLVVAVGDEDLGAEDAVGAVGAALGAGPERTQVRAGVRLGQIHGAGPLAGHHLGQVGAFQLVAALRLQRVDGAMGEQRAQAEGEVGRIPDLGGGRRHHLRQLLSAPVRRGTEPVPAARHVLGVGLLPAGRRDDLAVHQLGAGAVAQRVERLQHLGPELAGLGDDRADGLLVHTIEHAVRDQRVEPRRGLERVHDVVHWSLVGHVALARFRRSLLTFRSI